MPTPTYDLIASNVLTSSASSVTFSSIPATYRDLVLVTEHRSDSGAATSQLNLRFNSDSGSNYSYVIMEGNGSSTNSAASSGSSIDAYNVSATSTSAALSVYNILDYSATDKHKTVLMRAGRANDRTHAGAYRWANTAAINTITANAISINFASGSTFYLYGIVS